LIAEIIKHGKQSMLVEDIIQLKNLTSVLCRRSIWFYGIYTHSYEVIYSSGNEL